MSTVAEPQEQPQAETTTERPDAARFAEELRQNTIGVRLQIRQLGCRAKLSPAQIDRAARVFEADPKVLSGSKLLVNTANSHWRKVKSVISQTRMGWKGHTIPYPEGNEDGKQSRGTRLLQRAKIDELEAFLQGKVAELEQAQEDLQRSWPDLVNESRDMLRQLHTEAEYPDDVRGLFSIDWEFTEVNPPDTMRRLHPEIYEREVARVQARMEMAVQMHEQVIAEELRKLVATIMDKFEVGDDGKAKTFSKANMDAMTNMFDRFKSINLGSNEELEAIVSEAQEVLNGVTKKGLNNDQTVRDAVREGIGNLTDRLDSMLVDRPSRRIRLQEEESEEDQTEESGAQMSLLPDEPESQPQSEESE